MYKILSYAIIAFAAMAITACDEVEGMKELHFGVGDKGSTGHH